MLLYFPISNYSVLVNNYTNATPDKSAAAKKILTHIFKNNICSQLKNIKLNDIIEFHSKLFTDLNFGLNDKQHDVFEDHEVSFVAFNLKQLKVLKYLSNFCAFFQQLNENNVEFSEIKKSEKLSELHDLGQVNFIISVEYDRRVEEYKEGIENFEEIPKEKADDTKLRKEKLRKELSVFAKIFTDVHNTDTTDPTNYKYRVTQLIGECEGIKIVL